MCCDGTHSHSSMPMTCCTLSSAFRSAVNAEGATLNHDGAAVCCSLSSTEEMASASSEMRVLALQLTRTLARLGAGILSLLADSLLPCKTESTRHVL
eukprot:1947761-Prymnesium_polylepis.1